jgi:hypothetical protein
VLLFTDCHTSVHSTLVSCRGNISLKANQTEGQQDTVEGIANSYKAWQKSTYSRWALNGGDMPPDLAYATTCWDKQARSLKWNVANDGYLVYAVSADQSYTEVTPVLHIYLLLFHHTN